MVAFNKLYYREKGFATDSDKENFDFVQNGNANIQMFMNALKSEKVNVHGRTLLRSMRSVVEYELFHAEMSSE